MDKYSQRNCKNNGMTLLKVSGRRLLRKGWRDARWVEVKTYLNVYECYKAALDLCMRNGKYVKL